MKGTTALLLALATCLVFLAGRALVRDNTLLIRSQYPPTDVVFSAYREGSLGGVKLDLYQDQHFEFTWQGVRTSAKGNYTFDSDTLVLTAARGTFIMNTVGQMRFVVADGVLAEQPIVTGIKFLGITTNRLNKGQQ